MASLNRPERSAHDIQVEFRQELIKGAEELKLPVTMAEKVALLFRHSTIVPSDKHPLEILSKISTAIKRRKNVTDEQLMNIVDASLSKDPGYWNAARVWDDPRLPTDRNAFPTEGKERQTLLKKLASLNK
ncbi:MAG: hypothetical protein V1835_06355 [Candidatus Micrarchaeota archaeon]